MRSRQCGSSPPGVREQSHRLARSSSCPGEGAQGALSGCPVPNTCATVGPMSYRQRPHYMGYLTYSRHFVRAAVPAHRRLTQPNKGQVVPGQRNRLGEVVLIGEVFSEIGSRWYLEGPTIRRRTMRGQRLRRKAPVLAVTVVITLSLLAATASVALAWEEGPDWYINPQFQDRYATGPLIIELDGNSSAGQTLSVGDTIAITVDLHAVAESCSGDGDQAFVQWLLLVRGPSGPGSATDSRDDRQIPCASVDVNTTLELTYHLAATGRHTVYMNSYAAASQHGATVASEQLATSLTFEVAPRVVVKDEPRAVDIDIKPGNAQNCLNSNGHGVVPVAILGSSAFDVSTLDPFSLSLDGAKARAKGKSGKAGVLADVNRDGYLDLIVQFEDNKNLGAGSMVATLSGATYKGVSIVGSDSICIVPK